MRDSARGGEAVGQPDSAHPAIEDEDVVSASERGRVMTRTPEDYRTTTGWTRSIFVRQMEDGDILTVVKVWPENVAAGASAEWLVVSPDGRILARTPVAKAYHVRNATPDGHCLAAYWDGDSPQTAVAKLDVDSGAEPVSLPARRAGGRLGQRRRWTSQGPEGRRQLLRVAAAVRPAMPKYSAKPAALAALNANLAAEGNPEGE